MNLYPFILVLDLLTEHIQEARDGATMHFFVDDIVLIGFLREEINRKLEIRQQVLEIHGFCLVGGKQSI